MTHSRASLATPVSSSRIRRMRDGWKNLAKPQSNRKTARRFFSDMLWVAFPATSDHDLCKRAAVALEVNARTVNNWLNCHNDAPGPIVLKVLLIAGAEIVFQQIEGPK
ncbi:hypothetical protein [Phaeobacter sp. S60]|nr:hypothetical protein [Phaeobacter sp. S60]